MLGAGGVAVLGHLAAQFVPGYSETTSLSIQLQEWGLLNIIANIVGDIAAILLVIYLIAANIQATFLEPRERFIVHWARYLDGVFQLRGYYYREDDLFAADVVAIDKHVSDNRWFGPKGSWRIGTLLTRDPRLQQNYDLVVSPRDGWQHYFPGRLFEQEGPERLLESLTYCPLWQAPGSRATHIEAVGDCSECGGPFAAHRVRKYSHMDAAGVLFLLSLVWLVVYAIFGGATGPDPRGDILIYSLYGLVLRVFVRMLTAKETVWRCGACGHIDRTGYPLDKPPQARLAARD